jgi:hypothetical protein
MPPLVPAAFLFVQNPLRGSAEVSWEERGYLMVPLRPDGKKTP